MSKTTQALSLYRKGQLKRSLAIFKTFRLTFSKEQLRLFEIAYESLCGRDSFYKSLGLDTDEIIQQSKLLINKTYLQ